VKSLQAQIARSTIVECNVLYPSPRQKTATHFETVTTNGFDFCAVDIMDEEGDVDLPISRPPRLPDSFLPIAGRRDTYTLGEHLHSIAVGKHLLNYDSLVVYAHFKGHTMAGFGGSLKNIGIGCASGAVGKLQIHGAGWKRGPLFLERMVESGKGIADHFGGHITYINVLKNISVDCDCDGNGAPPTCNDIGILGSRDLLAIDKASVDLVFSQPAAQKHDIVERIHSRGGLHQLEYMKALSMGNDQYDLVRV